MHHSSSSSLVCGLGGGGAVGGLVYPEGGAPRPHQLPLHSSHTEVNGGAAAQVTNEVKTWNPFEDSFTQMAEDHLFGQEFDKIRQQGSQSSEWSSIFILFTVKPQTIDFKY